MDYTQFFPKIIFLLFDLFRNSHKKIPKIIFLDSEPKNYMGSFWVIQCKRHYPPIYDILTGEEGRGDTPTGDRGGV
jgi:hypothetical protein